MNDNKVFGEIYRTYRRHLTVIIACLFLLQSCNNETKTDYRNFEEIKLSDFGYIKTKFIKPVSKPTANNNMEQISSNQTAQYIFWGVFAFCFICCIIALIRTRQGKMITIVNWYDFSLLAAFCILWIIDAIWISLDCLPVWLIVIGGLCFLSSIVWSIIALIRTRQGKMNPIVIWYFVLLTTLFVLWIIIAISVLPVWLIVIGGLCFLNSIVWSIIANKGSIFNIIVSVFAKIFVLLVIFAIIVYLII